AHNWRRGSYANCRSKNCRCTAAGARCTPAANACHRWPKPSWRLSARNAHKSARWLRASAERRMRRYQVIRRDQLRVVGQLAAELPLLGIVFDSPAKLHALKVVFLLAAALGSVGVGRDLSVGGHGGISWRCATSMGNTDDRLRKAR